MKRDDVFAGFKLRRLIWVGPLTVLASMAAVLLVRAIAVSVMHPDPTFLPLTLMPAIVDTAVFVSLAVLVCGWVLAGRSMPAPVLALTGARFFTLDRISAFRLVAFKALLISFLPDIGIAVAQPRNWQYALALAAMHVAAWGTCVLMTSLVKGRSETSAELSDS
jgi:hypothetical protein